MYANSVCDMRPAAAAEADARLLYADVIGGIRPVSRLWRKVPVARGVLIGDERALRADWEYIDRDHHDRA